MSRIITVDDLLVFSPDLDLKQGQAMIDDGVAQAMLVAPCLADEGRLTATQTAQLRSILRGAILRWVDRGATGVTTTSTTDVFGPYSTQQSTTVDNTQQRRGMFLPSELDLLRSICRGRRRSGTVDTTADARRQGR
ncbi:MAG: hypothetical protein LBV06_07145 [Propionibacteriaceae bacterium]|jgi:hypothetical protein|nr:hypothetical protein [Propionibacteriaceae bacterium]